MFPLKDSTPRRTFPFINYCIIVLNVIIFFYQLTLPNSDAFVSHYAFIPAQFNYLIPTTYIAIFTSLYLHGGFLHIVSNMWFLHIFGDNIEDVMGHIPYLFFYLLAGFVATMLQYVFIPGSTIPMIGASGAISGIAGAYFVLFRRSKVLTLVTYFFWIWDIIELPVWLFLGYWFILQLFYGLGSVVSFDVNQGGVAWFAHVGGFIFGYLMARRLKNSIKYYGEVV